MRTYKYRVYLKGTGYIEVTFTCRTPNEGIEALRAQYGCDVSWIGTC